MPPAIAAALAAVTVQQVVFTIGMFIIQSSMASRAAKKAEEAQRAATEAQRAAHNAGLTDRTSTSRSAIVPRNIILGRDETSGPLWPWFTYGPLRNFHAFGVVLAGHQCDAIETVMFNHEAVTLDGSGAVTTAKWCRPFSNTFVKSQACTGAGAGIALGQAPTRIDSVTRVVPNGELYTVEPVAYTLVGGDMTITEDMGGSTVTVNYTVAGLTPLFYVKKYLGAPGQTAAPELIAAAAAAGVPGSWDATRKGTNVCYMTVVAEADFNILGQVGMPEVSAIVRGAVCYDRRTGLTQWTQNPALQAEWFQTVSGYAPKTLTSEIHDAELKASANVSDELLAFSATRLEARYQGNGQLTTAASPLDNLNHILDAMDGDAVWVSGQWQIVAGYHKEPTLEIDEDTLSGAQITVVPRTAKRDLFNALTGTYVDAAAGYVRTSYPLVTSPVYQAQDGDELLPADAAFELVNDAVRCQMIAWQRLTRARQPLTLSLGTTLKGYDSAPLQTCNVNLRRLGYVNKMFRNARREHEGATLTYVMQETGPEVWAWDYSKADAAVDIPNTSFPDVTTIPVPEGVTVESGTAALQLLGDGTVISRGRIRWTPSTNTYVLNGGHVDWQFKTAAADAWTTLPKADGGDGEIFTSALEDGDLILARGRFVTSQGRQGMWCPVVTFTVIGKTEPPPDVVSFAVNADGMASWSDVIAADLQGYQIRWQPGNNTSWGDANLVHAGIITDNPYPIGVRPSGVATFLIKAFDKSMTPAKPFGNESVNAAASVINLGDPVVENVIVTTDYKALGFPAPPNSFITLDAGQYPEYDASDFESFARATSAAYYDVAGVLQSAAADVPRFGYHPITHAYLGLLIEAAETRQYPHFLKFDGTDDAMGTAAFAAGTLTSAMDAFFVVRRDSAGNATLGYDSGATKFFASMESGSAVAAHANAGTPTYLVNGVAVPGGTATTRGQLHTALAVGTFAILEIRNLDLSTWTDFFTGGLASYRLNGGIAAALVVNAQSNAKRTEIRDYFYNVLGQYRSMYGTAYPGSDTLISDLFTGALQGLWVKPGDFTAWYQDSAATTPVTAVQQSVGKAIDKSGRGNHLLQATSGSRPVVSARINLLTKTDQFNDAAWGKTGGGTGIAPVVTANAALAPDGTMTADRIVFDKGAGATSTDQSRIQNAAIATITGQPSAGFMWIQSGTASSYAMRLDFNGSNSVGASYPSLITVTPTWQRFDIRLNSAIDTTRCVSLRLRGTFGTDNYADVNVWFAQQENGIAPSAPQRVNTATDYATIEETRAADACDILTALGGKVNCTVDGSGNLVADADASPLAWDANANTAGWTFDTAPGWTLATFKPMTYRPEVFTVVDADDGAQLTLSNELVGTSSQIEYRRDGDAPGWTIDSEPGWTDDAAPAWVIEAWRAWPGLVTARPGRYEFQVTIQSRDVQGAINALAAVLDVEDQTENVGLVPILAGGTVIPTTKTWRHVDIGLTLVADGGTAETARIEDRATRTVTTRNAANTSVPGTVIATLQGY
ncbi:MAG: phage tail protein [Pseudomonadota bacterium]